MALGNTDPLSFVSIGQAPDKPAGWNVVTLSDGSVYKYAGIVERNEGGYIVHRVEFDTADGQDTLDGPVVTPEIALAIEAVGGVVPPIHTTVVVTPPPPAPIGIVAPPPASEPAPVHMSWLQEIRAKLAEYEAWVKKHL